VNNLLFIAALCIILSGCEEANWKSAALSHECSADQHEKVERETLFCVEQTIVREELLKEHL